MPEETSDKLELAAMIKGLRAQLAEAQTEGAEENIRFTIEDVELELQVSAEQQPGRVGNISFSQICFDKKAVALTTLCTVLSVAHSTLNT
ncbi:MAG: hypothetical protein D3925_12480 [Candidatus Electrothrix sp. AR5]|nr:hypothetical protein [Candidatus Electrothrix sp. AR5]